MKISMNIQDIICMSEMSNDSIGMIMNSDITAYNGLIVMKPKHMNSVVICVGITGGSTTMVDHFSCGAKHPVRLFKKGESFTVTF